MKRTAAVIVTYNRKAMLQRCLRALCTQTAGVPELWVIDNASTDGRTGGAAEPANHALL